MPHGKLTLSQEMKDEINRCFTCALGYNMLSIGEMQALKMLIALQCLAEVGPRRPALAYVCKCIKLIMHPMMAMGIAFTTHAVLASVLSIRSSQSASLETDVSMADVSSLPSSIRSAGDLARRVNTEAKMEILTAALTSTPSEVPADDAIIDKEARGSIKERTRLRPEMHFQ